MTDDASRHDGSVSSEGLGLVERLRTDVLWHQRRGNETIARDCQEAADEIERLRAALAKANEQAERFERGWYLRGDALEGVLPYMEAAEAAGLVGDEGCHWPVEAVRVALKA